MLDNIREGTLVKAIGPGGIFVPDVSSDRKLLLISAGSGVTPMMAITTYRWDLAASPTSASSAARGGRANSSSGRRLEHMASRVPSIKLHFVVEQDDPHDAGRATAGSSTS